MVLFGCDCIGSVVISMFVSLWLMVVHRWLLSLCVVWETMPRVFAKEVDEDRGYMLMMVTL